MMKKAPRRLQDLRTRRTQSGKAENPHRRFLRIANLELRKSLCLRVREAALRRIADLDEQLAAITNEQASLLGAAQPSAEPPSRSVPEPHFPAQRGAGERCGLTVKY